MISVIDREALFCDETKDYRNPYEPDAGDTVCLRLRTARDNADSVFYIEPETKIRRRMKRVCTEGRFDYYEICVEIDEEPVSYHFEIRLGSEICFYNRLGAENQAEAAYAFRIIPGFHVPEWVQGAVMYQIYVDRFRNGDPTNDVETNEYIYIGSPVQRVEDWDELPGTLDVGRFYGGDLHGVWDKLDYLKGLGVECIYLNPVFVSPSNHKYDCQDYEHIDPHYGVIEEDMDLLVASDAMDNDMAGKYAARTADEANLKASDEFFAAFITAAHQKGIRVIIDGVFNHCGSFNKWMDAELIYQHEGNYEPGAYVSADSPYRSYFKFNNQDGWPFNDSYDGWWGFSTLPKLNYEESEELCQAVMRVAEKWVSPPFGADGWRLDVAADLGRSSEFNHRFWQRFRDAVKKANPQAVILAEHYGDPSPWLDGSQWDTVMNYDAFMEPVSWFLTGMEKHSDEFNEKLLGNGTTFFDIMRYHMCRMQPQSVYSAMNELSNHDHSRFMTRTNRRTGRLDSAGSEAASEGISYGTFRQGVVMLMTWPGAPTLYYGDETGLCGWTDPDCRRTYPWGREDQELIEFHRYMTRIHRRHPAFRTGSVKRLLAEQDLIAYARVSEGWTAGKAELENGEMKRQRESRGVAIVNTSEEERAVRIPVWLAGITDSMELRRCMLTYEEGYNAGQVLYPVKDGVLEITLPPRGAAVLTAERKIQPDFRLK